MLDRQLIRNNPEQVKRGARRKGVDAPVDLWLELDSKHRKVLTEYEGLKSELNKISKSIGKLMGEGKRDEAEAAKGKTADIKSQIDRLEFNLKDIECKLIDTELQIPNIPDEAVPDGESEEDNVIVRYWGEKQKLSVDPTPHWDIAERLNLIDFKRASKISGSGFAMYTGFGARLQRSLIQYMIDYQTIHRGYSEVYPPVLINQECLVGTGNLPKFEDDLYKTADTQYLIPTAETPLTNFCREEILDAEQLPMKLSAYSSCFRKEAGAAGKDTRGLLRMHQFDKIELFKYVLPEESHKELQLLLEDAESILQDLGLHYRVVEICAKDLSFANARQYDLEIWAPGIGEYLEISSCSNFHSFQARRAGIRFRRGKGEKPEYVHTLNGSGLALPRLYATILEAGLQPDGSVKLPAALAPYMRTDYITPELSGFCSAFNGG